MKEEIHLWIDLMCCKKYLCTNYWSTILEINSIYPIVHTTQPHFLQFRYAKRLFVHVNGECHEITLGNCEGTNIEIREGHDIEKMLFVGEFNWFRSEKGMRLIDTDELREDIHCLYSDDFGILEKIDQQSTAFDVDKVVEQLEKELEFADEVKKRCTKENIMQFDMAKGYANGIANSIEIVERGGRDCEVG